MSVREPARIRKSLPQWVLSGERPPPESSPRLINASLVYLGEDCDRGGPEEGEGPAWERLLMGEVPDRRAQLDALAGPGQRHLQPTAPPADATLIYAGYVGRKAGPHGHGVE